MDDDDDNRDRNASLRTMGGWGDDAFVPAPSPARLKMEKNGRRRGLGGGGGKGIAAALEEARNLGGGTEVAETPLRRPGTGDRRRGLERTRREGSCSPVGGYIAGIEG